MEERKIETIYKVYGYDELTAEDRELVDAAKQMTGTSFAPYSKFHVGAAIRQENAAFPSSLCAERTACFQASALYPGMPMRKIAIAAWTRLHQPEETPHELCFQKKPISPCGSCRQALLEYEAAYGPIEVLLYGREGVAVLPSIASLLPLCFTTF